MNSFNEEKKEVANMLNSWQESRAKLQKEMEGMTNAEKREYLLRKAKENKRIKDMRFEYPEVEADLQNWKKSKT